MKIYFQKDASLSPLKDKTMAIIGYGNQGRAQALNLRDNGITVVVGNREDSYRKMALEDGFETVSIADAAQRGDYVFILTTDESQPTIWEQQIAPGLSRGNTLVWASGYNVGYDLISPPREADVVMVAPRMIGHYVRQLFEQGKGAMALAGVHQDASGKAWDRMMAVARARHSLSRNSLLPSRACIAHLLRHAAGHGRPRHRLPRREPRDCHRPQPLERRSVRPLRQRSAAPERAAQRLRDGLHVRIFLLAAAAAISCPES